MFGVVVELAVIFSVVVQVGVHCVGVNVRTGPVGELDAVNETGCEAPEVSVVPILIVIDVLAGIGMLPGLESEKSNDVGAGGVVTISVFGL